VEFKNNIYSKYKNRKIGILIGLLLKNKEMEKIQTNIRKNRRLF
jgi:hypothetical protein